MRCAFSRNAFCFFFFPSALGLSDFTCLNLLSPASEGMVLVKFVGFSVARSCQPLSNSRGKGLTRLLVKLFTVIHLRTPPPPQEKRKWIRRERERIAILMLGCKRGANQHHPPTSISLSRGLWYLLALIDVFGHVVETHPIEIRCLFAIRCSSVCLLYVTWYS